MTTCRSFSFALAASLLPALVAAAPTAVEFQGVTIGAKLRTAPVEFKTKVGLAGGGFGFLAPGTYDVELASTGDKSRVMLLFFQKGRKMGETPGTLKLGQGGLGIAPCVKPASGIGPCLKPASGVNPCLKPASGISPCAKPASAINPCAKPSGQAGEGSGKRYFSFEQLGFTGGVKPSLRAGAGGGTLLTIPGAGGASVEAELPAAH
jgi:hypothetical protein